MTEQPTLASRRLVLRPFTLHDAEDVQRLAGAEEVADTTLNIPHPYADGLAEDWIESHDDAFRRQERVALAITDSHGALVGAVSLRLERGHGRAELGYWIGLPYWGRGYATEAASTMVGYGFDELGLNRIQAHHLARNPASGRVLEKAGFTHEGFHRAHVLKNGRFEDIHSFAVLRADYG
jgi:RimJ/RimL family protein N-acetyltransferase